MATTAYCVKCKKKQEMQNAKEITMKGKGGTKRRAMKGECPKCGTKMFRILGKA
jgi:Zn finger protein HypA/HybF involved in hydrogenase expression